MKKKIFYVTSNQGKFEEVKDFFKIQHSDFDLLHYPLDVDEIQSLDQIEVVKDKAKKAFSILNQPLLLDDGGIFFNEYPQFPGTLSKFIFKALGFDGLFRLINEDKRASFILQLAYTEGKEIQCFEGKCEGEVVLPTTIASHPMLPFTAIFKPNGTEKTLAELRYTSDFYKYSFRQQALQKFITWYQERGS